MSVPKNRWRQYLRNCRVELGWLFIWVMALGGHFRPDLCPIPATLLWLSAIILAKRSQEKRLVKTAFFFLVFWLMVDLTLSRTHPPAPLALWMALGLHLMLIWTPLELSMAFERSSRTFIGRRRASMISMTLLIILKVFPHILEESASIRKTLLLRSSHLTRTTRLILWGRNLVRLTLAQTDDLTRAIIKR